MVSSLTYGHDATGNITGIWDDGVGIARGYDALNRLTFVGNPGDASYVSYTYDAVGNRQIETTNAGTRYFVTGVANRLEAIHQTDENGPLLATFEYDDNGAVTARRDGSGNLAYGLTRNDRGQVASATGPFGTSQYAYDPRGYRVRRTAAGAVQQYHLEGEHLESIYDGTGSLQAKFLRGSVIDEVVVGDYLDAAGRTTSYTFHHDALESVLALSGHAGSVEEKVTYAPFGGLVSQTGGSPSALRYTGREFDADTGLYYYRARYYDPDLGRFLSPDPLGFAGGDVNLYAYAGNNPLVASDPSGKCPTCIVGAIIGGVAGAVIARAGKLPNATAASIATSTLLGLEPARFRHGRRCRCA